MSPANKDRNVLDYGNEAVGYGDEAVQRPADAVLVAQATGKKPKKTSSSKSKGALKLKTAKKLIVTDATDTRLKKVAPIYARQVLRVKKTEVKKVNSWQELSKLLQEYKSIEQLVLMFHGTPGSLIISDEHKSLSEVNDIFAGQNPNIKQIDFEGCSVGEGADELVPFARLFNSSKVTAWNHFWINQIFEVDIPKDVDVEVLEGQIAQYKGYFLSGTPTLDELAKKPGKHTLVVEWFRNDFNEDPLPPPPTPGDLDTRSKSFKPRSAATSRRIKSDEAKKLAEEYGKKPVLPLEHVIIEISY